ncbi:hypothetical protein ACFWWU_36645 [Streptomyces sp. NPDC058650]|uniref:hypothetical protein n=1 Tax=Streptomyces sp. NPDC058650 TaxID=3346575 RepID=UPI003663CEC1
MTTFVRRGEDSDSKDLDGWLVQMTDRTVTIANTPDWESLEFEVDYFTATYVLSDVIVSPFALSDAEAGFIALSEIAFVLVVIGLALLVVGILGRSLPLATAGFVLAAIIATVALIVAKPKGTDS